MPDEHFMDGVSDAGLLAAAADALTLVHADPGWRLNGGLRGPDGDHSQSPPHIAPPALVPSDGADTGVTFLLHK